MENPEEYKQAAEEQIKALKKLQRVAQAEEFNEYFDLLLKTVTDKMLWVFMSGVNADKTVRPNIQNWGEFCQARGEIMATLQPIQQIHGVGPIIEHLQQNLDNYYKKSL